MERKIRLDETLGLHLKEFRTQYKVKGKDIAEHLGKSAAYISKLEKGQIQQIDRKEFVKIANFIAKSEEGYFLFCEKIGKIADAERLQHDNFFLNFDWIERKIPVSQEIISEIKGRMSVLGVTAVELTEYINQNEDLGSAFFEEHKIDFASLERNVWIPYQEADSIGNSRSFIFLEYEAERIEDFVNGKIQKCEYMLPYAMLYHLLKMEYKRNGKVISEKLIKDCQTKAKNILLRYKFYSISIQASIAEQDNSEEDYKKLLNPYDLQNGEYVSKIINAIDFLSKYDVEYTNRKLKTIVENFQECDLSFAIAFMSTSLIGMRDLQASLKKEFLREVVALVEKYTSMAGSHENIEKY